MLKDMERIGAFLHANANREQTLYAVDILRESTERGVELLAETVFYPKLDDFEVDEAKELLKLSWDDCPQDKKVLDLIHEAAYGKDSALGRPLIARGEDLEKLSPQSVLDLRANIMVPERTVIAAAGIRHADLVRHVEKYFEPFWPASKKQEVPAYESVYVGGMAHIAERPMLSGGVPDPKDLVRVALGYECGGWHASELVPVSVLQSLLGGGDSFSAGGPGKGMYSRLYREVLNGKYWVESCEAFLSLHHQCGIFGIQGACPPKRVPDLVRTMHRQLARLASEFVSDEELARAKNMLKINFLTQLESRLVLFEDIVRQFSTFGQRQTLASLTAQIDAVTAHDIRRIGQRMMASKPSLAAHGRDLTGVPSAADVAAWPLEAVPKWFNGSR
ncbi:Metalloenzyme, LuxS/M16 peptidase-like protein [Pelagophyceae sp. CCMP2097]|nr:Metalloenzyme, LuxS/M16 peptidase-like protein [Pelagophyceae sp. CCMP2097]